MQKHIDAGISGVHPLLTLQTVQADPSTALHTCWNLQIRRMKLVLLVTPSLAGVGMPCILLHLRRGREA